MLTTDMGDNDFTTSFGDDRITDSNIGEELDQLVHYSRDKIICLIVKIYLHDSCYLLQPIKVETNIKYKFKTNESSAEAEEITWNKLLLS